MNQTINDIFNTLTIKIVISRKTVRKVFNKFVLGRTVVCGIPIEEESFPVIELFSRGSKEELTALKLIKKAQKGTTKDLYRLAIHIHKISKNKYLKETTAALESGEKALEILKHAANKGYAVATQKLSAIAEKELKAPKDKTAQKIAM